MSRDVAVVSRRCRQVSRRCREVSLRCRRDVAGCRGGVAGCRRCRGVLPSVKSLSPTKVTQQSYQKVCFEQFGSGLERRRDVAAMSQMSQPCRKVSPMSRWCRSDVALVSPDVAVVSPDVAAMSRWCRQMSRWCRGGVASVAELSLGVDKTIFFIETGQTGGFRPSTNGWLYSYFS